MRNKILKWTMIMVLSVSLAVSPAVGVMEAHAGDDGQYLRSPADTNLEGKNAIALMVDSDTKDVLQDPMFYRYYDIGLFGQIKKKTVDTDEMEKYNTPSADTKDMKAEVVSDMNCMGCGISGLGKAEVPSKYKNYKRYNCLDISEWQKKISASNWKTVKNAGVTHVIIRVGGSYLKSGSSFSDTYYEQNITNAYNAGLKIGVYYFSQALTTAEAQREAEYTLKLIKPYKSKITMPVVFDYESNESGRLTGSKLKSLGKSGTATKICEAFCEKVKSEGYTPMVYANYTTLENYLNYKTLQSKYKIWLANYTTKGTATTYPGEYYAWQYSSSGRVSGISGDLDMNYIFSKSGSSETSQTVTPPETNGSASNDESTSQTQKPQITDVTAYKVKVKSKVNYRTGPGTSYTKKGSFKKGKILTINGKCKVGDATWGRTKGGNFLNLKYTKKYGYQVKTTTRLNYRTGPGTSYKVKGTFAKGKVLTIVSKKNGWGKTSGGNYVLLKYTKKL
ncbi:MAG: GH25 family lysozyme [Firmicutes bacterium]|nr:GH25 family lysozyme [Bacillota bacterium]